MGLLRGGGVEMSFSWVGGVYVEVHRSSIDTITGNRGFNSIINRAIREEMGKGGDCVFICFFHLWSL